MKIFKYSCLNIRKKLFVNFIIMIQVMASCFLFYSALDANNKISQEADRILNVFNGKKAWYMKVSSEFNYNSKPGKDKFTNNEVLKAYNAIKSGDFTHFYIDDDFFIVKDFPGINDFIANPVTAELGNDKYMAVKGFRLDKIMNKEFKLKFVSGHGFSDEDFENIVDIKPVILGYDYADKYKVGDIIDYLDSKDKSTMHQLKVIGILEPDSSLLYKIDTTAKFMNLNTSIVQPFIDLDKVPKDEILTTYYIQVFNLFNTSYLLFDDSKTDEEITQIVDDLNNTLRELNIGKLDISSVDKYLAMDKVSLISQKKQAETLALIVILFLCIGILSSLMYSIRRDRNQIGVHILSGATLDDISLVIFVQNLLIMLIGFILSFFLIKNRFPSISYPFMAKTLLMLIVLSIAISIIPMRAIKKLNVNELIRSGE